MSDVDPELELAPERPPGTVEAPPVQIVIEVRADSTPDEVAAQALAAFAAAQPVPAPELEQPAQGEGWGIGPTSDVGIPGIRVLDSEQPTEADPSGLAGPE